jgi:hypothetical protein
VTADLIFLETASGGSSNGTVPWGESADFDILAVGFCRSMMRAPTGGNVAFGTTNVSPKRLLNRPATSRASSRCWRWSSPIGTSSVSYSRMSATMRTG